MVSTYSTGVKSTLDADLFRDWLSRIDKDAKTVNVHKDTVSEICRKSAELPESDKPLATLGPGGQRSTLRRGREPSR